MLSHTAYERLRQAIYSGRLAAGERIVERDLARRFRISRIPLRESLIRLQAEGLIRSIPYSSSYVEDFEPGDVLEIYSMRLLIEPLATRLCALHPSTTLAKKLERLCVRMHALAKRASPRELDRIDYAFHHAIVQASGHRRLLRAYEGAHIQVLSLSPDKALPQDDLIEQIGTTHERIVNQIARGNADRAEAYARQHVEEATIRLEHALGATLAQTTMRARLASSVPLALRLRSYGSASHSKSPLRPR